MKEVSRRVLVWNLFSSQQVYTLLYMTWFILKLKINLKVKYRVKGNRRLFVCD